MVFNTPFSLFSPSKWYQKHTCTHTKNITVQAIDYNKLIYATSIENPRVGGSIPPLGTTFIKHISSLLERHARLSCVIQKHTINTLFAVLLAIWWAESRCWTQCWLMLCYKHCVDGVLGKHCWEHKAWSLLVGTKDFTASPLSGHWCISRRTAATSPLCDFGFPAACARSRNSAATAQISMPLSGIKTGHSCKPQREQYTQGLIWGPN